MNTDKYYLYRLNTEGEGELLIRFRPGKDKEDPFTLCGFHWSHYSNVRAWNMPMLFPTLEQAETFVEQAQLDVRIGRWISMDLCQHNEHPDAYEYVTWKPGDT